MPALLRWLACFFASQASPTQTIAHSELGTLSYDDSGFWNGIIQTDGTALTFALCGDSSGPFPEQARRLQNTVADFGTLRNTVYDSLASRLKTVAEVRPEEFRIHGLWFLWPTRPDYFIVEMALEGDQFGLWKLEFEGQRATHLSRDD
jgi:hypothetical protein